MKRGSPGRIVRALKGGERTVCVVAGSGEHRLDDSSANGLSDFQTCRAERQLQGRSRSICCRRREVPSECTVLVIAGPTGDYIQPEVDAIKKYVEDGGRAMFLLDPPLRLGRNEISDNGALVTLLASLGRDARERPASG